MEFLVIILLLLLSAFFHGAEAAFVSSNRLRAEISTLRPGATTTAVRHFYANPGEVLKTTFVGSSITLIVFATLVSVYAASPIASFLASIRGLGASFVALLTFLGVVVVTSTALLIFGVLLPRVLIRSAPTRALFRAAVPLRIAGYLLLPVIWLIEVSSDAIARLSRLRGESFEQMMQRDFELRVAEGRDRVEEDEGVELLENVLNMTDVRVKESMVPRTDIMAVSESASIDEVRARFVETGLSKLPVYRDNLDRIVGTVFAHDLFGMPQSLADIIRPARYVPESKLSKALLREFLGTSTSIAIVIDEYGGTAGLVTREDLLEELFGDIRDEFDAEEDIMRQVGDSVYIVSGRVRIEELNDRYDLDIKEGDYETLAGYVLEQTGAIPSFGEELQIDHLQITVLRATSNRLDLMKVERRGDGYPA